MINPLYLLMGIIAVLFSTVGLRALHRLWCSLAPPRFLKLLVGAILVPLALVGAWHLIDYSPGDVSEITAMREKGVGYQWRAFTMLPETPEVDMSMKLPHITVHIVGDRQVIQEKYPEKDIIALLQYYLRVKQYHIWVVGRQTEHGILINQESLGHELMHVLNLITGGDVLDPDELKYMGL